MSKPTVYEIAERIRLEGLELKEARAAMEFFRTPLHKLQATRHKFEVNFTSLLSPHWHGLRNHSRISPLVKYTDYRFDDNAFSWDEIRCTYPVLVEVLDAKMGTVMPMDFLERFMGFADSQAKFKTYPWTRLYRFMLAQNASMIQAAIVQAYWRKVTFEHQQQIANLKREEAKTFEQHSLDRESLTNLIRTLAKDMSKLEREIDPVWIQLQKYQSKMSQLGDKKKQLQMQIDSINRQLAELPDTAKESLIQQAARRRGQKLDLSQFEI